MDNKIKIILLGDTSVGKTSILKRKIENIFDSSFTSTLGVDFYFIIKEIEGKTYKIYIWDTAGQEKFSAIIKSYFRDTDGAIIVFDTTCLKSFENVETWIRDLNFYNKKNIPFVLAGTKNDIRNKSKNRHEYKYEYEYEEISEHRIAELSRKYETECVMCSSKENENIDHLFDTIIKKIVKNKTFSIGTDEIDIVTNTETRRKPKCCAIL